MIVVLSLLSIDLTAQNDVWIVEDGSVCMTPLKAAKYANMKDSLNRLYIQNQLLEDALQNSTIVVSATSETINTMLKKKKLLEHKITVLEERLNLKSDKIMLYSDELDNCSVLLNKSNKTIKNQKSVIIVTSTLASVGIVALIVTILTIVI